MKERYEDSLKISRDLKAAIDTSFEEGLEKGKKETEEKMKIELAKEMKRDSEPIEKISKYTKLSSEEIEKLPID